VQMFFWGGTAGGIGVLLLVTTTSAAVVGYFARNRHDETAWHRLVAPAVATVLLLGMTYLALTNIATLFGVAPGSPPTWVVPAGYAVVALAGIGWALVLRAVRPRVYEGIGLGARSSTLSGLSG
jgi:4-amino-4-deoxy-L-arabinose transferase-like glycosyltransferase